MTRSLRISSILVISLVALALTPLAALAHGRAEVGKYEIYIGFHVEPAFQGDVNGAEFFVTNMETQEPVNGLEETLQMEIIYGESRREVPVETQWGEEGAYIGYVQPTATGDYTIHIWGDIEGTPADVTMTSSPDTFSSISPKSDIAFPAADPTSADMQAMVTASADTARLALIVASAAAVLGLAGVLLGLRAKRS
jgi:hypothetical protein